MEVLHLSKFYKPFNGGLEAVVADLAEGYKPADCFVIASDAEGLEQYEWINGVQVIRSKELYSIASTSLAPAYITDTIKFSHKKIVHMHYPNPMANLALFFAWIMRKDISNLVIHWHSDIVKQRNILKLYKPLLNWSLKKAKKIIVTSPNYLEHSRQLKKYRQKCVVIPIGINSIKEKIKHCKVQELINKYKERKIIFSLGRHTYYKGFEYLVESAQKIEDSVILIGGKGQDTIKYKELIDKYGVGDKVKLIGRIEDDDLPSYYAAAEIFCLPSIEKSEAFGVVQLEAMSVGTPVVSTNIEGSGVPWVNKNMCSGLVCEPKDANSLANSLRLLLSDDELRLRLSKGALNRFESMFTREKMVERVNELYQVNFEKDN